ncbi:Serine/threonine-protein kinase BUD32 [Pseudomassariella vexata]|uniref:EKC/KEOPS complex subunit BUD32 n=1 Tax=Pseudomassariella vexata TaxID=1141098 RepID=A0A1Y2DK32_9PEZI|nr:Serine/threonine-protein kinase BUD32 [Pseudomassariella vexata]ORY59514.1 Serine/threonine-protein kinase BUD32 [Pseudomassariella vexata]
MTTLLPLPVPATPADEVEAGAQSHQFPLPQTLNYPTTTPPTLITQGAEGRLYKTTYLLPSIPCALKHRPSKPYRHPILDQRLTRHRILSEARILQKCRREGVPVPALYAVDEGTGVLIMEWIAGAPVRVPVNEYLRKRKADGLREAATKEDGEELVGLMRRIGRAVGRLHKVGIVHGDLTTSNMMLRPWDKGKAPVNGHKADGEGNGLLDGEIVIIDFGLASQGTQDEDRAVDLYVLERAFGSTHPRAEGLFEVVLDAYRGEFKTANIVLKKLEDVRMRGRKRSMLG